MDFFVRIAALVLLLLASTGRVEAQASAVPARIEMYGGQVSVYRSDRPLQRVAVGNGELVNVTTVEKRQLVVIAGAGLSGETTMHLWYEDGGQRTINVTVIPINMDTSSATVRRLLALESGSKASVHEVGGNIVVTGELTPLEKDRVDKLSKLYPNLVDLSTPDLVAMQPMVLMDVRIMEFRRTALRDLGIRWDNVIDGPSGGAIKDFSTSFFRILPDDSPFIDVADVLPPRINPMQTYFGIATSITSKINLLTENGDAYELATPQLSARSGGEASFLAGGEIPIPIVGAFGSTSVEYKEYGIKLDIKPVVNGNNEISAEVLTEISKVDTGNTVLGVPGFLTRKAETEINLSSGQTMVISGLVDVTGSKGYGGIPGLSNIPILGRLFRSDEFRSGRTDLVIFVTPRVITPDDPANIDAIQKSDRLLEDFKSTIGPQIFD